MAHITVKHAAPPAPERAAKSLKEEFAHPVRARIMSMLGDGRPRTQRELGRGLLMSSAAVHYHLAALVKLGTVRLDNTRPGPNGITEKVYAADHTRWQAILKALDADMDLRFYLDYTSAWMHERHREGLEVLKAGDQEHPFLLGSFAVNAPLTDVLRLKRELYELVQAFHKKHSTPDRDGRATCAVTFSILPSLADESRETLNVLEYEPDPKQAVPIPSARAGAKPPCKPKKTKT